MNVSRAFGPLICKAPFCVLASLLIGACVTITQPAKNSTVSNPVAAAVTVNLSQYCDSFKATLDGTDVTNQFSPLPPAGTPSTATLANLSCGSHTLVASANTNQYWFLIPYCGSDSDSATFTVPPVVALPSGDPNAFPFGGDFPGDTSHHYQQLYMASAFCGPVTITALKFFGSTATTCSNPPTSLPFGVWSISLSTTSVTLDTLSTNYGANIGSHNTTVFNGPIAPLAQPWTLSSTLTIPVNPPFTYTPVDGNLLMDVVVTNFTQPSCLTYFQATGGGGINASTVTGHVDDSGVNPGYGLVTEFD